MLTPYREKLLAPSETIALITRPHVFTFWANALLWLIVTLFFLVLALALESTAIIPQFEPPARRWAVIAFLLLALVGVLSMLAAWVRYRSSEIIVTDRRVLRVNGVLSKDVIDNGLDAITDLQLRQSPFGRLFDYGDVEILTASDSSGGARDTFPAVAGPIRFMHAVQAQREARRPGATPSGPTA